MKAQRLAAWAWQHDNPAEALPALRDAAALSGRAPEFLKALAVTLAKAHCVQEAVDTLQELLKKTPADVEAWCVLGELSLDRGDFAGAARALGMCLGLDRAKTHPSGLRARALIHRTEKQLRKRR